MKKLTITPEPTGSLPVERTLRYKILFIVLPLFLISFTFFGITVYFSTNKSITNVTKEFIGYRLKEISEYSQNLVFSSSTDESELESDMYVQMVLSYAQKFTD